jgi:hypothetical protein
MESCARGNRRRPESEQGVDGFQEFTREAVKSLLWQAAELTAAAVAPVPVGPVVVRCLYLSRQMVVAARGVASGEGFDFKMNLPGLDLLNGSILPPGFELVARLRVGQAPPDRGSGLDIRPELQFFEQWFNDVDVANADEPRLRRRIRIMGLVEISEPGPRPDDPWTVWLALLGDDLIHRLAATLDQAGHSSLDDVVRGLTKRRHPEQRRLLREAGASFDQTMCHTAPTNDEVTAGSTLNVEVTRKTPSISMERVKATTSFSSYDDGIPERATGQKTNLPDGALRPDQLPTEPTLKPSNHDEPDLPTP